MNQHFQEVELNQGKPQPGDLFLFELQTPKAQYFGLHVGVYCGNGEIIHFEGERKQIWSVRRGLSWRENWDGSVGL